MKVDLVRKVSFEHHLRVNVHMLIKLLIWIQLTVSIQLKWLEPNFICIFFHWRYGSSRCSLGCEGTTHIWEVSKEDWRWWWWCSWKWSWSPLWTCCTITRFGGGEFTSDMYIDLEISLLHICQKMWVCCSHRSLMSANVYFPWAGEDWGGGLRCDI